MYEKVIIIPQSLHFISEDERFELPLKQIAILLPLPLLAFPSFSLIFSLPEGGKNSYG